MPVQFVVVADVVVREAMIELAFSQLVISSFSRAGSSDSNRSRLLPVP